MKGAFVEAIDYFSKKEIMHPDKFYLLAAEARVKAFTVSNVSSLQILKSVHGEVQKSLEEGTTLKEFQKSFDDILFKKGYDPLSPWQVETVFRTNIQTAYSVGRYQGQKERAELRPYLVFNAIDDSRTTELCYELGGSGDPSKAKCYRFDHPFWDVFYPPNHFNCRSSVDDLSEEEVKEEGLAVLTEDQTKKDYYPVLPDGTQATEPIPLYPPEGFDVNPGKVVWEPDLSKYGPEQQKMFNEAYEKRFGPVRDMDQLKDRLSGIQDNFNLTGVDGAPVKQLVQSTYANGWWNENTNTIGLHPSRYTLIEQVLSEGKITDLAQADALSTLCHELGHTLGVQIDGLKYRRERTYRFMSQIVNDCWSRAFFPDFCEALKLSNVKKYAENIFKTRDSVYQFMVNNFMQLMESAGMDRQEFSDFVWKLNLKEDPAVYEKAIREEMKKRLPGVKLPKSRLGLGMTKTGGAAEWLGAVENQRALLGKEKGNVL